MNDDLNVGDVVYARFPLMEREGSLPHYCLVLEVYETLYGKWLALVYGSSKKVSISGHLPCELVVIEESHMLACGLKQATRFDLRKRGRVDARKVVKTGSLPTALYNELRKAAIAANLL